VQVRWIPPQWGGERVDRGELVVILEAGDPQLEEAGEDEVAFRFGEVHAQGDDRHPWTSPEDPRVHAWSSNELARP